MPKIADALLRLDEGQLKALVRAKRYQAKLEDVESRIRSRQNEIDQLQREHGRLERRIRSITRGATVVSSRTRRGPTLADAIIKALTKSGPLGLTELTRALLKGPYKTSSAFGNFRTTVAHTLAKMKDQLTKSEKGYAIKKAGKKATKKVAKPKAKKTKPAAKKPKATSAAKPTLKNAEQKPQPIEATSPA